MATPVVSGHASSSLRASPLHVQLLLMMGSCAHSPPVMAEAARVQRLLHRVAPDVDLPTRAADREAEQSAEAASQAEAASDSGAKASSKGKKEEWTPASLAALSSSTAPEDLLLQALLMDPASPHLRLRDPARSLQLYGLAAIKMPSTYACARLAHFWITGEHVAGGKDVAKGAKWLRMGAARGHALCQYQLAFLLEEGMLDGRPDAAAAIEWYRKAADLKYPPAMFNLATLLIAPDDTYDNVEQDAYTAIRLMEDAAALGDSSSQLKLGHLCFVGDADLDLDASIPRCIHYLTLAAHNDNEPSVDAAKILGIIFSMADTATYHNEHYDLDKAIRYLKIAADSGHADSATLLKAALAKAVEVKSKQVLAPNSQHEEAMRLLSLQEGKDVSAAVAIATAVAGAAADSAPAAAASSASPLSVVTSTPSAESLLLALTRVHSRFPELGATRLHARLKAEYPHWELSEKRVKRVVREQGWVAEGAGAGAGGAAAAAGLVDVPTPAIVLADSVVVTGKQRGADVVVNDLD